MLLKLCRYLLESLFIPISNRKVKSLTRFGDRLEELSPWPTIVGFTVGKCCGEARSISSQRLAGEVSLCFNPVRAFSDSRVFAAIFAIGAVRPGCDQAGLAVRSEHAQLHRGLAGRSEIVLQHTQLDSQFFSRPRQRNRLDLYLLEGRFLSQPTD